jgi:1-phosphofructokinase family hexose kinase
LIVCSVVNPAIDAVYSLDELEPGVTTTDTPCTVLPAGKGINIAKAVKALGEGACVVALMPGDDGPRFERCLDALDIHRAFFTVEGGVRICSTIVEKNAEQVTHLNSAGMRLPARIQDEFLAFAERHMHEGDTWALAGSLPRGFGDDVYMKIIETCRAKGIAVLLDTRGRALNMGARAQPLMIKPNITELEAFFGEQIQGVHHMALKGKRLLDMGIEYAFISLGADGMIAVHENECLLCSAPKVDAVDTVGCGDALDAGLLVAHVRRFSFAEMCRLAIACGASNARHRGAGNISKEEVWQLMEHVSIEAV